MEEPKKETQELRLERQKFKLHKEGYEGITKAIKDLKEPKEEKPEVQKVELLGVNLVTIKGDKGDKGDSPSKDELTSIIKPLIPEPLKGDKGDNYNLTTIDKKEIANSIKVPIVEKVIEKTETIIEKPTITEIVKEVAIAETADQIVSKLQGVKKKWLSIEAIDGDFNSKVRKIAKESGGANALSMLTDVDLSGLTQDDQGNYILGSGGGASPLTTKGDIYTYSTTDDRLGVGEDGQVLTADSTATTGLSWEYPETPGNLTFMFANVASDISTYYDAVALSTFVVGTQGDITTAGVSTTPTLLGTFATELGFPGIINIPAGIFHLHYETEKVAGANNYYTYAEVYKRAAGGTETLLLTSDNSTQTASNTVIQHTVGAPNAATIPLLSTDRIVVKIYGVMVSSTATIHLYFDNGTDARLEMPSPNVDASNFVTLSTTQTITGAKTFNDTTLLLRNVANTFNGSFTNTNTADRVYTLRDATGTIPLIGVSNTWSAVQAFDLGATVGNSTLRKNIHFLNDIYQTTLGIKNTNDDYTIELPSASGTLALTSDLTSFVVGVNTAKITVSASAPGSPVVGDLWFDTA